MSSKQVADWIRVAAGLRLVASSASRRSTQELAYATTRAAQHAAEVLENVRVASQVATETTMESERKIYNPNRNCRDSLKREEGAFPQQTHDQDTRLKDAVFTIGTPNHNDTRERFGKTNNIGFDRSTKINGGALSKAQDSTKDSARPAFEPARQLSSQETTQSAGRKDNLEQETSSHSNNEDYDQRLQEGRPVPSTRIGRAMGFASLGLGLLVGTAAEATSRLFANSSSAQSVILTDANADRLSETLCRMRGAAMKLGQMLSIQDATMLPPPLTRALQQVRQGADAMPQHQLESQLESQLGEARDLLLEKLEAAPFAAASIGQVHLGILKANRKKIVLKVQYPGVADSIDSDLNNLQTLISLTGLAPPGLFLENVIRVGRKELKQECDYAREAENQKRFQRLVSEDFTLQQERFVVPSVIPELSTQQILASEYAPGGTIDKVEDLHQEERNRIARTIMYLTVQELFVWRFMQTDPNWGNFLYDVGTGTTYLIDFGAAREYSKSFVDGYLRIVWAASNCDADTIMHYSHKLGFLTGEENEIMVEAHKKSGFTVGEPFRSHEPFDFRGSKISSRLSTETSAFLQHRLTPPPEEIYTLHRKLAGAYMLCIKLGAVINCREMLEDIMANHVFDDDENPPEDCTSNNECNRYRTQT